MKIRLNVRDHFLKLESEGILAYPDIDRVFSQAPAVFEFELEELIDVHDLLEMRRQVAVIWSVEDVQEVRPDLDDEQSWAVLQRCRKVHDCTIGLTWELIEAVADDMFPEAEEKE